MRGTSWWAFCLLLLFTAGSAQAQQGKHDAKADEAKVRDMIAYLSYFLNTIGSNTSASSDKDVLITESYSKIFRDSEVQVEDDLDPNRSTVTYKDVQAYLKDVDFFFDNVKFDFHIDKITSQQNVNGQLYYRVQLTRNLSGITSDGVAVNNTMPRFVEVNYNPVKQDLRIVSIYTHEFDESEMLKGWWNALSYEWQAIFRRRLNLVDSVQLSDIRDMMSVQDLDLSNNNYIQNIDALARLTSLRTLDLSGTDVNDLDAIRNLTELTSLNVSHTSVEDLSPLRYSLKMRELDLSFTTVHDISVVTRMTNLNKLNLDGTHVTDFSALTGLASLQELHLSQTGIGDLSVIGPLTMLTELHAAKTEVNNFKPIAIFKNLEILDLDSTHLQSLAPLKTLQNLRVLHINYTGVDSLDQLLKLPHLERVYCDHTAINQKISSAFMAARKGVLVIFDSEDLKSWWGTVPFAWRKVITTTAGTGSDPTKEELVRITNLDSINIGANKDIISLEPLRRLSKLQVVIANNTAIAALTALNDHTDIRFLDVSNTFISDIEPIRNFKKLEEFRGDGTRIRDLSPLEGLVQLRTVFVDQTGIGDEQVQEFLSRNPACLVIYNTNRFKNWWDSLSSDWKKVLRTQITLKDPPPRDDLHRLVELQKLTFEGRSLSDLSPLTAFIRLREVYFTGTAVSDLTPLSSIPTLEIIRASGSPLTDLAPLSAIENLEDLDVSNTAVEDLRPLVVLERLKRLDISGTPVKKLDPLVALTALEYLDCSNTHIKKLDPLERLPLKTVKCFNTSVSSRRAQDFQLHNPDCEVVYFR